MQVVALVKFICYDVILVVVGSNEFLGLLGRPMPEMVTTSASSAAQILGHNILEVFLAAPNIKICGKLMHPPGRVVFSPADLAKLGDQNLDWYFMLFKEGYWKL